MDIHILFVNSMSMILTLMTSELSRWFWNKSCRIFFTTANENENMLCEKLDFSCALITGLKIVMTGQQMFKWDDFQIIGLVINEFWYYVYRDVEIQLKILNYLTCLCCWRQ